MQVQAAVQSGSVTRNILTFEQKNLLWLLAVVGMVGGHIATWLIMPRNLEAGVLVKLLCRWIGLFWPITIGMGCYWSRDRAEYLKRILIVGWLGELPYFLLTGQNGNDVFALAGGVAMTFLLDAGMGYLAGALVALFHWWFGLDLLYLLLPGVVYELAESEFRDWVVAGVVVVWVVASGRWFDAVLLLGLAAFQVDFRGITWRAPLWVRYSIFPVHYAVLAVLKYAI